MNTEKNKKNNQNRDVLGFIASLLIFLLTVTVLLDIVITTFVIAFFQQHHTLVIGLLDALNSLFSRLFDANPAGFDRNHAGDPVTQRIHQVLHANVKNKLKLSWEEFV